MGVFPIVFTSIEKTLTNYRSAILVKAPKQCSEIDEAFEDPQIRAAFCNSLHKEKYNLYDKTYSSKQFGYCIYSSKKSIELISENQPEIDRFLVMDATFSISPKNMFYQVLIIYARYFEKVKDAVLISEIFYFQNEFSNIFFVEIHCIFCVSDLSACIHHDD